MNELPLVSIIVNNYNYGRYLKDAIDSAINQTYFSVEVIVVDDGSTDESLEIIAQYADKIIAVKKQNEGQASAFNSGYKISKGEIILFLDSDDVLSPTAAALSVGSFRDPELTKVHWPLWEVNEFGQKSGRLFPGGILPEGNLVDVILENGPDSYSSPPTSGNAWSRKFLEKVLPMPIDDFRISADRYLFMLAPLFGPVGFIRTPQGYYRIHGKNNFKGNILKEETLRSILLQYDTSCDTLKRFVRKLGLRAETENWKYKSWYYKIHASLEEIKKVIPENETFILVDEDQWEAGVEIASRKVIPFMERNGAYDGPPPDDKIAIMEIERHRRNGACFIVFAWPAFWWINYYSGMYNYLNSNYKCLIQNERLLIYSINERISNNLL